jgi:hypothetical protein
MTTPYILLAEEKNLELERSQKVLRLDPEIKSLTRQIFNPKAVISLHAENAKRKYKVFITLTRSDAPLEQDDTLPILSK